MTDKFINLDEALLDPTKIFNSPQEILDNDTISNTDKLEILKRWEYDARELELADDENMTGRNNSDILHEILHAIDHLLNS